MKRLLSGFLSMFLSAFLLSLPIGFVPQTAMAQQSFTQSYGPVTGVSPANCTTTAGTTTTAAIAPCGGQGAMFQNSNVTSHTVTWTAVATVSTCTLELETSSTGTGSWVIMSGSAIQTCTSTGSYTFVGVGAAYVRVNLLSLTTTGSGSISFNYSGTVFPAAVGGVINCGVSNSCASPVGAPNFRIVYGTCTASSATTCAQTGIAPAFTSSTSFFCTASDATTAANGAFKITYVSSSAFTVTTSSSSDVFNWICWGT